MSINRLEEFYNIVNASPAVAILLRNEEGWPVEFVSENVELLLGYTTEELISEKTHFSDIAHPDDLVRVTEEISRNSKEQGKTSFANKPYRIISKDRSVKWIDVKIIIRRDEKGEITHYQGIVLDITDRIKAEEELQQKSYELGERVKELNCLYSISKLIEKENISDEALFQSIVDLVPPSWQFPEITCARIILADKGYKTDNFKETKWKQSSDIIVNEEKIGALEVYYMEEMPDDFEGPFSKEERDLINGITKQLNKIIERINDEKSLRSERDKLQVVFNAIGDGLYIPGQDYTLEYMNKSLTSNYGDALGKECYKTFYKSTAPCDFCMLKDVIETNEVQDIDIEIQKGKSYNIVFSPFLDLDNHVKAIVLRRDISEKRTLEAEAIHMAQLASLGELAAGIAHEINNPITGIISCAELWQSRCIKDGKDIEIPTIIIDEGLRASRIVKNLLSFAREKESEDVLIEVEEIISNTLGLTEKQIIKDGTELHVDITHDLPKVRGRSNEIQHVFLNILSNSRYSLNEKYTGFHQGKILKINTEVVEIESGMLVRTIFNDSGTGIPSNLMHRICNPFFSTKPEGEGTGLGLSISHGIISKHGGKLWFESVEGEYTRAVVDLPVAKL